jgi:hypothetical protein
MEVTRQILRRVPSPWQAAAQTGVTQGTSHGGFADGSMETAIPAVEWA